MKLFSTLLITTTCCLFWCNQMFSQAEDDVVINEFVVNPATGKEYVELLVVATSVNMQGWTISDVGSRAGATSTTEGDITFPASASYLASVPRGTYIVIEFTTPVANTSTLTEDLSLSDASPRRLILKTTTSGVTTAGTMDISTNENVHLYAGTRAAGTLIDQALGGTNSSYIIGAVWGDNNGATTTDNINGGSSLPSGCVVRFVPTDQTSPAGFQDNDTGIKFTVDASSYGTPGSVNTGVNDGGGALPIQLASFTSNVANGNEVRLEWTTVSEVNNYGFFIERRTEQASSFTTVSGLIPGAGTTLERQQYSWAEAIGSEGIYYYRLRQVDLDGLEHYSPTITVNVSQILSADDPNKPEVFSLGQNYPNPFNPTTDFEFRISNLEFVSFTIFNVLGEEITTLVHEMKPPGSYRIQWNAANMPNGMYFYRLQAGNFVDVKKMMLLK